MDSQSPKSRPRFYPRYIGTGGQLGFKATGAWELVLRCLCYTYVAPLGLFVSALAH